MNGTNSVDIKNGATVVTNVRISNGTALQATAIKFERRWHRGLDLVRRADQPGRLAEELLLLAARWPEHGSCP